MNTCTNEKQVSSKVILQTHATLSTIAAALNFRTQSISLVIGDPTPSGAGFPTFYSINFVQVPKSLIRRITHAWKIASPSTIYDNAYINQYLCRHLCFISFCQYGLAATVYLGIYRKIYVFCRSFTPLGFRCLSCTRNVKPFANVTQYAGPTVCIPMNCVRASQELIAETSGLVIPLRRKSSLNSIN